MSKEEKESVEHAVRQTHVGETDPKHGVGFWELTARMFPFLCFMGVAFYTVERTQLAPFNGTVLLFLQVVLLVAAIAAWVWKSPRARKQ